MGVAGMQGANGVVDEVFSEEALFEFEMVIRWVKVLPIPNYYWVIFLSVYKS